MASADDFGRASAGSRTCFGCRPWCRGAAYRHCVAGGMARRGRALCARAAQARGARGRARTADAMAAGRVRLRHRSLFHGRSRAGRLGALTAAAIGVLLAVRARKAALAFRTDAGLCRHRTGLCDRDGAYRLDCASGPAASRNGRPDWVCRGARRARQDGSHRPAESTRQRRQRLNGFALPSRREALPRSASSSR